MGETAPKYPLFSNSSCTHVSSPPQLGTSMVHLFGLDSRMLPKAEGVTIICTNPELLRMPPQAWHGMAEQLQTLW